MNNLAEIRDQLAGLDKESRAELAVYLLGGLEDTYHYVSDEEVLARRDELESGAVEAMSHDAFMKAMA